MDLQVKGGYNGCIRLTIQKSNSREFQAEWESQDWTRFPARIRAAATALRDTNHFGTFYFPGHRAQLAAIADGKAVAPKDDTLRDEPPG